MVTATELLNGVKRFDSLTTEQQAAAVGKMEYRVLEPIFEGFSDVEFQEDIDAAWAEAERMQTPWFFHEIFLDREGVRDKVKERALAWAKEIYWITNPAIEIERI